MAKMVYITQNVPDVPGVPTKKYNLIYGERHTRATKRHFIFLAYKSKKTGNNGNNGNKV